MELVKRVEDFLSSDTSKFLFTAFYAFWADNLADWVTRFLFRGSFDDYSNADFLNGDDSTIKKRAFFLMRLILATFIYLVTFSMVEYIPKVIKLVESFYGVVNAIFKNTFLDIGAKDKMNINVLYVLFFTVFSIAYAIAFLLFGTVIDHWGTFCTLFIGVAFIPLMQGICKRIGDRLRIKAFGFFGYFIPSTILLCYPFLHDEPEQSTFIEIAPKLVTFFVCILIFFSIVLLFFGPMAFALT